jgi:hypothetical protein
MRAVASVPPPAPQGQISVIGRVGKFPCAEAGECVKPVDAAAAAAPKENVRRVSRVIASRPSQAR